MAADDEYFGVDEEAVTYAGRPVAVGSEQDRITKAMRRYREQQAANAAARNDMMRSLNGEAPVNPAGLNDALSSGRLRVSQVPVLPVASGPYIGTEDFTEAAGAPSTLPGGFGIQPQAWGTGNRRQRAFEKTLENISRNRDRMAYEHDLKMEDRYATDNMRRAFEVFKNNLPASAKMKFSAYVREQARLAKAGMLKEKPASWLDLGRFQEWEREQREIEYRQTVLDKGEDSEEAKALAKRIGVDPSKKWVTEQKRKQDDAEQAARLGLAKEQFEALKAERLKREEERKNAEKLKAEEGGKKALNALRRIREDAYNNSWRRATDAVRNSMETMGLSPEEATVRAQAIAKTLYRAEVERLLRGIGPEEMELIKKHGLEGKLFEMDERTPAEGGDAGDGAGGKGGMGGGAMGARGGGGMPQGPEWHARERERQKREAAAAVARGQAEAEGTAFDAAEETHNRAVNAATAAENAKYPPPMRRPAAPPPAGPSAVGTNPVGSNGVSFGRKAIGNRLPSGVQAGERVKVGSMEVIIDDAGARNLKEGTFYTDKQGRTHWRAGDTNAGAASPWDTAKAGAAGGLTPEQSEDARWRLMTRPEGKAVVRGDMSEYAGAPASTLENIARLKAQGVGEKAGQLLTEDSWRAHGSFGSIDGGAERTVDDAKASKRDLDAATKLLMSMPAPARAQEIAAMRANPEKYRAAGVPVDDILAMYQGA